MRLISGAFALLFLAACGADLSESPRVVTSPAFPSPTLTALNFSCRLPFSRNVAPGQSQAGFIDFPSGVFTADPSAPPNPGYYDRAVSRWLPVWRNVVAPDGRHYAYMTGGTGQTPGPPRLHVVDAASGLEQVTALALSDQQPYWVVDFALDGIYIESGWEVVRYGIWRVNPNGTLTDLGKERHFVDDGTGHAWVSVFDPSDPHPAPSAMSGDPLPNEVGRRDLKTGAVDAWFYHPGFNVAVVSAFVGGGVLAVVEPSLTDRTMEWRHEYWLVSAPSKSRPIAHIEGGSGGLADSHGIWMGSLDGLYLISRAGDVKQVSSLQGYPGNGCV